MEWKPITIGCGALRGVDAVPVTLEISVKDGSHAPRILGQVDSAIREAYHRVLVAFRAQDLVPPRGAATMNFTPAGMRKSGPGFDLPMALGLAAASGQFAMPKTLAALGEVSLCGDILPAQGIVAMALAARDRGWTHLLTDPVSAPLAALVPGLRVYGATSLREAVHWLRGETPLARAEPKVRQPGPDPGLDLCEIRGHQTPKTALMVAAAGRHNLLMVGPPGSGKTALAQRVRGLLPDTTPEEWLEVLKIHTARTITGVDPGAVPARPLRCPHHSSSAASLLGGGPDPRPGEVSLAQHGVLFLDELPEFRREVLEGLRQPLEDGELTIGRVRHTVTMPADFLLVGAMNPCPCGYYGHDRRPCSCNPTQRERYRNRISGPLLDRIDLQVEVPALPPEVFRGPMDEDWSTATIRRRVAAAVTRQRERNANGRPNGRLNDRELERVTALGPDASATLDTLLRDQSLSGRARVRFLRVARTLADLDGRDPILPVDVHLAARLRGFAPHAAE